jgi:YegS/Rv2252/BmrU family lipid kinase
MGKKVLVVFNKEAGSAGEAEMSSSLRDLFKKHHFEADIKNLDRTTDLTREILAAKKWGASVIAAAGGDGTVSAVASCLVRSDLILGVLPMGTLNHFAKDLKIPLDLDSAVETICVGTVEHVDVGEINEATFINNSSLGLYPKIVRQRRQDERRGMYKWFAFAKALGSVLMRHSSFRVIVSTDNEEIVRKTQLLFVGNNEYEVHGFEMGTRKQLTAGELCVYMTRKVGSLGLFILSIRALLGKLKSADQFEWLKTRKLVIETARKSVAVSLDGEVATMTSPLHYKVLPKVLKVMVPRPEGVTLKS